MALTNSKYPSSFKPRVIEQSMTAAAKSVVNSKFVKIVAKFLSKDSKIVKII